MHLFLKVFSLILSFFMILSFTILKFQTVIVTLNFKLLTLSQYFNIFTLKEYLCSSILHFIFTFHPPIQQDFIFIFQSLYIENQITKAILNFPLFLIVLTKELIPDTVKALVVAFIPFSISFSYIPVHFPLFKLYHQQCSLLQSPQHLHNYYQYHLLDLKDHFFTL